MSAIFISHSSTDNADADVMAAWLMKQGHTSYFIDYDEISGISAGTDWEQALYQRLRQCQAIVALVTPDWLASKWCFAEMIQAREKGKPIFPVITKPCQLPGLLSDTQKIDLTADPEGGYRRLALGLKENGLDPADVFDWDPMRPPYPGLPSFEVEDAAVFFGRGSDILETRETLEGLRRHNQDVSRLVLVLGSSGSGKSSLVRAGLIPRLKKDKENWLPLRPFRPQDESNPVDALAFAFADTYEGLGLPCDTNLVCARLSRAAAFPAAGSGELLAIARELTSAAGRRDATVLITVDQAEELFGSVSLEIGKTFLQFLGASLSTGDRHLMAIGTLRSDFLGIFQDQVALLGPAYRLGLNHLSITVEPIPVERYAALIEGPANRAGIILEGGLVQRLLQDAGQPDSLPLLAFTLRRLYDLRFEGPHVDRCAKLAVQDYEKLGGLAGAVQNAADRIVKEPKPADDEIAALRDAFIPGLVRTNDEGSCFRSRAFFDELPLTARSLLKRFINARLLVAGEDGQATVEIAHEALLRTWPTLVNWLVEDRDKLRQYNTIVRAAQEWDQHRQEDPYVVHRDGRLEDAKKLVSERRFAFSHGSVERAYLDACTENQLARESAAQEERQRRLRDAEQLARAQAERAEEAEKRAKEQKEAASKLRRRAFAAAGTAAIALILLAVSVLMWRAANDQRLAAQLAQTEAQKQARIANDQRTAAEEQARIAESRRLAAESSSVLIKYPQHSLLLAVESGKAGQSIRGDRVAAAEQSLRKALAWTAGRALAKADGPMTAVAISPDNRWVVTGSGDKTARLWDLCAKDPGAKPIVLRGHEDAVNAVAISLDSRWVVTASSGDKTARLWDLKAGDPGANPVFLRGHEFGVSAVAISPDNRWAVTGSGDTTTRLWDLRAADPGANPVVLRGHEGPISAVAISPDNRWVVTGSVDTTARLWDLRAADPGANPVVLRGHEVGVSAVAISLDSRWVVTGSGDTTARLWDLSAKDPGAKSVVLRGHEQWVSAVAISPDNRWVVTGSGDTTARLWDLSAKDPGAMPVVLRGHDGPIGAVAISQDKRWVVTGSADTTARLWDLSAKDPGAQPIVLRGHAWAVTSVAISPDNRWVVTGCGDTTVRLWDLRATDPGATPVVLRGHDGRVIAVAISQDKRWVVTGSEDTTVRLWDLRATDPGATPVVLPGHEQWVSAVAISPDNRWVVTGSEDRTARLWDLSAKDPGAQPIVLRGHESGVKAVAISADKRWVVTGSADTTARLWDLSAKDPAANPVVLRGHDAEVSAVAISPMSPNKRWVVTGSADTTARLWDLSAKDPAANPVVLRGHDGWVYAVAISPDNRWVLTGSGDKTARLWLLQMNDLIDLARTTVGRNFSADEWLLYFPGEKYRRTFPDLPGPD